MSGTEPTAGVARRARVRWLAPLIVVDLLVAVLAISPIGGRAEAGGTLVCVPAACVDGPTEKLNTVATPSTFAASAPEGTTSTVAVPAPTSLLPAAPAATNGRTTGDTGGGDAAIADAPTPTLPPPPPEACGAPIAKGSGGEWQCSFADNFDGSSLDPTKWMTQQTEGSGYHSGSECYVDSPNNVLVADGVLSLTVRQEPQPFMCTGGVLTYRTSYTSGMVSTYNRFAQTYGRFEIRARAPASRVRGLQTSIWLWPTEPRRYGRLWPASGEIDIAEIFSGYADRVFPHVHYNGDKGDPNATTDQCFIGDVSQFHTYALEWTPTELRFIYDGSICMINYWNPTRPQTRPQPFDQPFIITLTQALGIDNNAFWAGHTEIPATTQVDYVHVWQ